MGSQPDGMHHVVVREYARLTVDSAPTGSLVEGQVTETAFEWLCRESARLSRTGASLVQLEGRRLLRLDNYVGVIETPCGTRIEILPKSVDGAEDAPAARRLLKRMLARCLDLPRRETGPADIEAFRTPLTEWVMHAFLEELNILVKKGVRFDYRAVREQQPYLRGRLETVRQFRQPPGRAHLFQIEHDVFDADRPENRLLASALDIVRSRTREQRNWRLAHELAAVLHEVPRSQNVAADFRQWQSNRLMGSYRAVRPWCALLLDESVPMSIHGTWRGKSLLFPMETVFERYVEVCLRAQLQPGARLRPQASHEYLCEHAGDRWFNLQPDFLLEAGDTRVVLDTKWKRVDSGLGSAGDKYGLRQADFYQLFAYGHRYLGGAGNMLLVYPLTRDLQRALPPFAYAPQLQLAVVPFDLVTGRLTTVPREFSDQIGRVLVSSCT